jgi:hypothetical protein
MHEQYSKKTKTETQVQAFPGRMCGYWKPYLDKGHKFGPIRTSCNAMHDYIKWYADPDSYVVPITNTLVKPDNIGIKIKEYKKVPIICDTFNGKNLYTEEECNETRKKIRKHQIDKKLIDEHTTVGKADFKKLSATFFEKEGDLFKYSHKGSPKKLWKPDEITKEHTNLCNVKDATKKHNTRIIERRPTYIETDGVKELRYKIFYYGGVEEVEVN